MRAGEAAALFAAGTARARDRPAEARLVHGRALVHVLAVEVQAGFETQYVARADSPRLHLPWREQRAREALGVLRGHRDLVAVLAGIPGSRYEAFGAGDRQ